MSDSRIISVAGHQVGLSGLDEALESLGRDWAERSDQEVGQELLRLLSPRNYIPDSARPAYAQALADDYRRSLGQAVAAPKAAGLEVKVLGMGCNRCEALTALVLKVLSELGQVADVQHVKEMREIARYQVMGSPALVINDQVKAVGSVPPEGQIRQWLQEAAAAL